MELKFYPAAFNLYQEQSDGSRATWIAHICCSQAQVLSIENHIQP